jgi:hypothetical protein
LNGTELAAEFEEPAEGAGRHGQASLVFGGALEPGWIKRGDERRHESS